MKITDKSHVVKCTNTYSCSFCFDLALGGSFGLLLYWQVRGVCIDTRVASAPADIMPRATPHLHKIQPKDPVMLENGGYVSFIFDAHFTE